MNDVCDRCGGGYTYLGLAPICLKCDAPGDYIRRGRTLRGGTKLSPEVQKFHADQEERNNE